MAGGWPPDLDGAPTLEEVVESLSELLTSGTATHQRTVPRSDLFEQVRDRLAEEDVHLLMSYEEHVNDVMRLWGEDRFRIGYALGAGMGRFLR
jgi:hypothetical protein